MKERLVSVGIQLAIIAGLYFAMGPLDKWLMATLVGAVVLPLFFPFRFERIASGLAYIGVGAFFYFYGGPGYLRLAGLLAVVGVVMIVYGVVKLRGPQGHVSE